MNPDKKQQLINDYLEGNLSEEDLAFLKEAKEAGDPIIEEMRLSKKLLLGLKLKQRQDLKAELTTLLHREKKPKKPLGRLAPIYLGLAATLLLVATFTFVFNRSNETIDTAQLFEEYYQPMPTLSAKRSETAELSTALKHYGNEDFLNASNEFEAALRINPEDEASKILLANCYMNLEEHQQAIPLLEDLMDSEDVYYRQYSLWYLSLNYLKTNQIERSSELLSRIAESNMIHAESALELLKALQP